MRRWRNGERGSGSGNRWPRARGKWRSRVVFARGRRWAEVRLGAVDLTKPASALVRWFNVWAGIDKRMPPGAQVTLSGVVRRRNARLEFANPDILAVEGKAQTAAIIAR